MPQSLHGGHHLLGHHQGSRGSIDGHKTRDETALELYRAPTR
jgi:hypothetical protein